MSLAAPQVEETELSLLIQMRQHLANGDARKLAELLDSLRFSDALREILQLTPEERDRVFSMVPAELTAGLIEKAPTELAVEFVERLEAETAAGIMDELASDVQADVIGDLDEADAEAILEEMDVEDAAQVRRLAAYKHDSAGGLMAAEAFVFQENDVVGEVLRRLAMDESDFERYRGQHPYILDAEGRPVGVVSLRSLLTAPRGAFLSEIMVSPVTVSVDTQVDALRDLFDENLFLGVPVIEADGRLVGVVSRTTVDEANLERAESERMKLQGVFGDELRSMPSMVRSRRRLAWLSVNVGLNIIAASVISAYEETLSAVIAIAVFLPMVSDMSGCSGNQAVAVTMRELSLGLVKPLDAIRVWYKEAYVGVINGIALGLLIGLVAWIWKGNPYLGLVIGLALALNTLVAVSIGGVIPLLLKYLGQDPAVASGPLLTTITDMVGFFLVLSLATAFLPLLT
jgi:magnesium transporter